ncbi:phosphate ABC transporter substrate-binding protein (PhoT family) [Bacillus oleivorans]|uniref:Phosphate-binding protein n=1 Tax=Bacillus oleivorans TaxID=1448271 RepID=A0A285CLP0_9BACI|nr:PstS family phosphate ABC transporter substrate-binding protein [Bacillus oleivorans]SNX67913.1 phosphate ABC transporter substrate-binding protein (PhoT family) [Bacillus oleivorans]
MNFFKKFGLLAILAAVMLFAAACGTDNENGEGNGAAGADDENDAALSGEIAIDGSSTVYPIMEAVAEEFTLANPDVKVTVAFSGTGGGFEKFIAGSTQMSNASRPIKDEEAAALEEAGTEYTEFELAKDGLSVVVNPENDFIDHLTVEELKKMWIEDGSVKKWSDIRPEWPDEEIKFYSPGTASGTYDYWNEVILEDEPMVKDATLSEDDNVLVTGVTGDKYAIGFFGYAYYQENQDKLKVVPVDGGNGPVEPNAETVETGEYAPLSRPLYTYVDNAAIKENPAVYEYVKFLLENSAELAASVGYVSLPEENYTEQLELLETLK